MRILLVIYDNNSYIHWFPVGMAYIASAIEKAGHEVVIYNQDIHHYPEEHLTNYLNQNHFDIVGISVIGGYYQYRKLIKLSEAINLSNNRPCYIIGGHGPSPDAQYFLRKTNADVVVTGEGEVTIVELLDAIYHHKKLNNIKGIAFFDGNEFVETPRRELIKDVDSIATPSYHLFPMEHYRLLRVPHCTPDDFTFPVLSGRGCTFTCNFCYRLDEGFRQRSNESIIEEIIFLQKEYQISYIIFCDELLMSSVKRTASLCEDFIKYNLKIKWNCNGRLNYARPQLLKLMKKAGCVFINYGIESFDNQILKNMNKVLTTNQITRGIEATLSAGISPGLNIIFGNIGENLETLQKGVDFLMKYDDGAQMRTIRPVTPYPGSPLYYHAIKKGLIKDCADFYENKHLNSDLLSVNFTDLSDDDFHKALYEANLALLENYTNNKKLLVKNEIENLYLKKNISFRGFRTT